MEWQGKAIEVTRIQWKKEWEKNKLYFSFLFLLVSLSLPCIVACCSLNRRGKKERTGRRWKLWIQTPKFHSTKLKPFIFLHRLLLLKSFSFSCLSLELTVSHKTLQLKNLSSSVDPSSQSIQHNYFIQLSQLGTYITFEPLIIFNFKISMLLTY